MYDERLAQVYDIINSARKDYAAEASALADLLHGHHREARSLLDVACGTGEHLRHLRDRFADLAGVDASAAMLAVARAKLPGMPLRRADMRTLDLGRRFDVVCCLFSAIGYLRDVGELGATAARLLAHLNPGGIAVVEPWLTPDAWQDGYVSVDTATGDGLTVARMGVLSRTGRTSHLDLHYLVGDPAGVRYFADRHELTLFTRDEYLRAFTAAGWHTTWQDDGPYGRGLLLARQR